MKSGKEKINKSFFYFIYVIIWTLITVILIYPNFSFYKILGTFIFIAIYIYFSFKFLEKVKPIYINLEEKDILFLNILIFLDVIFAKLFTYTLIYFNNFNIPNLFVPSFVGILLTSLFHGKKMGAIYGIIAGIPAFLFNNPILYFLPMIGAIRSTFIKDDLISRAAIFKSSMIGACGFSALLLSLILAFYPSFLPYWYKYLFAAFLGGLYSFLVVNALIPLFEVLFDYTTNLTYLNLSNLHHPLLRKLLLKAPGTYNHSVMVATLAEAAAEAIGANTVLAKCGAIYHDIGKIKRPEYFIENQHGYNPHDFLDPRESAEIIKSHVTEGIKLGKKYKLPKKVIDCIAQHHGNSLIKYFYEKAKRMGLQVNEKDFRYPGPKPQFREAGIIMLADVVEAATRAIKDDVDINLKQFIHKLIQKVVDDDQLSQSGLSLKDIRLIEKVFFKILSGVYHKRIKYEKQTEKEN